MVRMDCKTVGQLNGGNVRTAKGARVLGMACWVAVRRRTDLLADTKRRRRRRTDDAFRHFWAVGDKVCLLS